MMTFAGRNAKEILRDPINLAFGLGFPLVLLLLLSAVHGVHVTQLVYHSPLRDMGVLSSLGLLKTLGTEFYGNADVLFSR